MRVLAASPLGMDDRWRLWLPRALTGMAEAEGVERGIMAVAGNRL